MKKNLWVIQSEFQNIPMTIIESIDFKPSYKQIDTLLINKRTTNINEENIFQELKRIKEIEKFL